MFAYVGSRTTKARNARGKGISVFRVAPATGALELVQCLEGFVNPSFLALNAAGDFLYTVHGDMSSVSAFGVDRLSGALVFLNSQDTGGKNPVHLALDPAGRHLVVSNHIGSSLSVLPIAVDGTLRPLAQVVRLDGPVGPHRIEQQQSKPHANAFDPTGRFVMVPDKGLDRIFTFEFAQARLAASAPAFVAAREGAGPRHIVFHPRLPRAYVVNELDSTIAVYRSTPSNGALVPMQIVSSLPDTCTGNSRAAEILMDASGHFVYASNRGHDSISVFEVHGDTGLLRLVGNVPSGGETPRCIALAPDGRFLYALNEDSDTIVIFSVHGSSGGLKQTGLPVSSGSPVSMVFSPT